MAIKTKILKDVSETTINRILEKESWVVRHIAVCSDGFHGSLLTVVLEDRSSEE